VSGVTSRRGADVIQSFVIEDPRRLREGATLLAGRTGE
jgi:hypothetical protein